jgi:hypothetical protein
LIKAGFTFDSIDYLDSLTLLN